MEILYDFSLSAAKKYPEYNFIYRPHPMANKFLSNLKKINLKKFYISKINLKLIYHIVVMQFLEDLHQFLNLYPMDCFQFI